MYFIYSKKMEIQNVLKIPKLNFLNFPKLNFLNF